MIKYALGCAEGHEFESWFSDSAAFEKLRRRRLVACPECGSTAVDKAIMAPAIVGAERAGADAGVAKPAEVLVDDKRRQVREMVKHLHKVLEEHRTAIRNIRRDGNEAIKKAAKDRKITEDEEKRATQEIQKLTDDEIKKMEDMCKAKEKEVMEIK